MREKPGDVGGASGTRRSRRVVLQCCGYKRCPTALVMPDGSLILEDKDDGKDERIYLRPEQVEKLRELLGQGNR